MPDSSRQARTWGATGLIAAPLLVLWLAQSGPGHRQPTDEPARSDHQPPPAASLTADRPADPPGGRPNSGAASGIDMRPASLQASQVDGRIGFDRHGRLVVDLALKRRFDYYLSAIGEIALVHIRDLLMHDLYMDLSPNQVRQVLDEFDLYTEYLRAVEALLPETGPNYRERLALLQHLQRDLLGEARAQAWFGEENDYLARTLDVLDGHIRPGDPDADPWTTELAEATGHHLAVEMNLQYDRLQLDPALRLAEREALYGTAAAQRLAQLDAERAAWQARVQSYISEYRRLLQDPSLSAAEIERRLTAWRQLEFNPAEQRRILALQQAGMIHPSDIRPDP